MNKRTRAVSIPTKTKREVEERDHCQCIFCGKPGRGEAHFISRAHGGLGIKENLITVCRACHDQLDNSIKRNEMLRVAENYLRAAYPYWDRSLLIYQKGIKTKDRVQLMRQEYEKQRAESKSKSKNVDLTKAPEGFWYLNEEGK